MLMRRYCAMRGWRKCRTSTARSRSARGKLAGIVLRVPHEDEVRLRWQHLEAQVFQLQRQAFARVDHGLAVRSNQASSCSAATAPASREAIQRVGVEGVLDALHRLRSDAPDRTQSRRASRPASATWTASARRAGSGTRSIKRQRAFAAEVDVRLVDQHHAIRACLQQRSMCASGRPMPVGAFGLASTMPRTTMRGARGQRIDSRCAGRRPPAAVRRRFRSAARRRDRSCRSRPGSAGARPAERTRRTHAPAPRRNHCRQRPASASQAVPPGERFTQHQRLRVGIALEPAFGRAWMASITRGDGG